MVEGNKIGQMQLDMNQIRHRRCTHIYASLKETMTNSLKAFNKPTASNVNWKTKKKNIIAQFNWY